VSTAAAVTRAIAIAINSRLCIWQRVWRNRSPPLLYPMKEEAIEIEGNVKVVLPGTMFRVELDNKHLVLATISGKMRKRFVRLTVGDRVKMQMSPYDLDKARIVWRLH